MRSNGFVGNIYWYVKDKQIYGKFKIFYTLNFCFLIVACFLLLYTSCYTLELVHMLEQTFYITHVHYYPPVSNGNRYYLRHVEWLWPRRHFSNQANIPRKHFIEMLFYPHSNVLTRPISKYSVYELAQLTEFENLTARLFSRPYYSKIDRMLSSKCPSPFWDSFHVLPYNKPKSSTSSFVPY